MARFVYFDSVADLWKQPNFSWYMGGQTFALVGMWAQKIAIGWLTWELTGSNFWIGVIAFADLFPTIIITPIAGVIADRVDRLRMSRLCQALGGLQAFALAALTFTGLIDIWTLFALTLSLGIVMAFGTAARLSLVPNLMDARYVPAAIGVDSSVYNLARVVGPMIAAALINFIGTGATFLVNGVSYIIFVACMYRIHLVRNESSNRGGKVLAQSAEGMRYAARHAGIGPALVLLTAAAIGVKPFLELLPGLADGVFHAGVDGFATLAAAAGTGAICAALWMAARGKTEGTTRVAFASMMVGAAGIFVVCATPLFWVGLVGTFFAGASVTLAGTATQTLMQNSVAGAMRGRVMSLYGMIHRGAPALGALVIGGAAERFGLQAALVGGAVLTVCVFFVMLKRYAIMAPALETPQSRGQRPQ